MIGKILDGLERALKIVALVLAVVLMLWVFAFIRNVEQALDQNTPPGVTAPSGSYCDSHGLNDIDPLTGLQCWKE